MSATTLVFATGIIVIGGKWAKGETLDVKVGIGVAFLAIFLSVINGPAPQIATGLAALVFLSALFAYGGALLGVVK